MKKVAVLLAGCGVYDGSEIHETVFALLALDQMGIGYQCVAPNRIQHHVIDHTTGEETPEARNILVESARIARGDIQSLDLVQISEFDGLLIPGGFGAAKNLNQWALAGPEGTVFEDVQALISNFHAANKAICGLCMGPTVIGQALAAHKGITLTMGSTQEKSPYDIQGIAQGLQSLGVGIQEASLKEICVSEETKIVSAPCYMMEGSIKDIHANVVQAVSAFAKLL
ncbi:MAG: enhancing lycopene biosynthesis protein 2 [Sphingobacteriales bacterium]|jgi:enhancing lycopene biosynthesis protein 2